MMNEISPGVRKNLNVVVTVTEVLPPLLSIIQPTLRPVSLSSSLAQNNLGIYNGNINQIMSYFLLFVFFFRRIHLYV